MAPPVRHPSPLQQLAELAADARADGLTFDAFWTRAMRPGASVVLTTTPNPPPGAVRFPTDANEGRAWLAAFGGSREGWRRPYEGMAPTAPEAALAVLGPWLSELSELDRERGLAPLPVAA